jgi:hypothetical protein
MMGKSIGISSGNKIPLFTLLIWISLIGYFIWQRANQSNRPPIYDAFAYYEKAKNFWNNVYKGFPENPLNVSPAARPPGTVLMSYPFGFDEDYHGFLFRSVFIPFLIWVITILILIWPKGENKKLSYWPAILLVFLLGPLPFFFQFDVSGATHWGLVDSFLAAMSALSFALAIKSIEKRSRNLLLTAILMTSICPLIKPSGYLIFLLIAFFWSLTCLLTVINKNSPEKKTSVKYWWMGSILFFITGIIILYLGISSEYLGIGTRSYFTQAISVLNNESKGITTYKLFFSLFYDAVGPQFWVYCPLFVFLLIRYVKTFNIRIPFLTLLLSGFLFILIGVWFWVWMTGISKIRYFYPFLLLGFVSFLYCSNEIMNKLDIRSVPFIQQIVKVICILPALNILLLLSMLNPNNKWQENSGVGININRNDQGVKIAKQFLALIEKERITVTVYDMNMRFSNNSFASYAFFDHSIHPDTKGFNCIHPIDWIRPSTYRLNEIIMKSDYIIFQPMQIDEQKNVLSDSTVNSFDEERIIIEAFLNSLSPEDGLQSLFVEKDCRLSKITDKVKLMRAFEPFLYSRHWRTLFMNENKITTHGWNLFQKSYQGLPHGYIKDTSTLCRGSIDVLAGVFPAPDTIETNSYFTVEGWLAYDPEKGIKADEIIIVLVRPDGTLQYWPSDPFPRPDVGQVFHQTALIDAGFTSLVDVSDQKGVYTLMLALGYKGKLIPCNAIKRIIINK